MSSTAQTTARRWLVGAVALAAMSVLWRDGWRRRLRVCRRQTPQTSVLRLLAPGWCWTGVVAVVNGDVILESDVDEERRFEEIQPYRAAADSTRDKIDRAAGGPGADSAAGGAAA